MSFILPQNSDELAYVYLLIDPRNNQPFYVGKTIVPLTRLQSHISDGRTYKVIGDGTKRSIILGILNDNLQPIMRVIEITTVQYVSEREFSWWKLLVKQGLRICNKVHFRGGASKPIMDNYRRNPPPSTAATKKIHDVSSIAAMLEQVQDKATREVIVTMLQSFTSDPDDKTLVEICGKRYIARGQ